MADEDPELQQLRHVLPVQTAAPVDVDTTTSSSPGDLVSVHIDRVTYEMPGPPSYPRWSEILEAVGPGRHLEIAGLLPMLGVADVRNDAQSAHSSRSGVRHARLDSIHGHG